MDVAKQIRWLEFIILSGTDNTPELKHKINMVLHRFTMQNFIVAISLFFKNEYHAGKVYLYFQE